MNRLHCVIAVAALAVAGALFTTSGFARQPAAQALVRDLTNLVAAPQTPSVNTNDALVGLWRLTKGRFNGKEFSVREGQTVLKLAGGQGRFRHWMMTAAWRLRTCASPSQRSVSRAV